MEAIEVMKAKQTNYKQINHKKLRNTGMLLSACLMVSTLLGCGKAETLGQTEKITLTYMVPSYGNNDYVGAEMIKKINAEYPDVEIQPVLYSEEQYYTVLKTRLATGKGPDLFFIQPDYAGFNGTANLAEAGYLAPVTEMESIQNTDSDSSVLLKYEDEVYGVSIGWMSLGILYNKTIFKENSIEVPTCWDEFLECCETLKKGGIWPLTIGGKNENTTQYGVYQIAANQIYPKDEEYNRELREGSRKFTDKGGWEKVLEMYAQLYEKDYLSLETMSLTFDEARKKLVNREAAMFFSSNREAENLVRYGGLDGDEYGYIPMPTNDRGEKTFWSIGETGGIGIYASSEHKELCMELLEKEFWPVYLNREPEAEDDFTRVIGDAYRAGDYYQLCNQGWRNEVEIVMEKKLMEYVLGGNLTIADITRAMQRELER